MGDAALGVGTDSLTRPLAVGQWTQIAGGLSARSRSRLAIVARSSPRGNSSCSAMSSASSARHTTSRNGPRAASIWLRAHGARRGGAGASAPGGVPGAPRARSTSPLPHHPRRPRSPGASSRPDPVAPLTARPLGDVSTSRASLRSSLPLSGPWRHISSRARFPSRPGPCQNTPTAGSAAAHRIAPYSPSPPIPSSNFLSAAVMNEVFAQVSVVVLALTGTGCELNTRGISGSDSDSMPASTGQATTTAGQTTSIQPSCGDTFVEDGVEECDDGNSEPGDACSVSCAQTEIVSIGVGGGHTCVAFKNGTMRCWGRNEYGALCNGGTDDLGDDPGEMPVADVNTGGAHIVQVTSGAHHSCSRSDVGNVQCWGVGESGQLGQYSPSNLGDSPDEVPVAELDLGTSAEDVSAGGLHTCAIVTGGTVRCWGYGGFGQLGSGDEGNQYGPKAPDVPGIKDALRLALGTQHTCVLQGNGDVRCWGRNSVGQLGLGNTDNVGDKPGQMPPPAVDLGGPAVQLAAGGYHNCAVLKDETVRCWGQNQFGQTGKGVSGAGTDVGDQDGEMPPPAVKLGGPAAQVVAGTYHTCALLRDGNVKCWGQGSHGALGNADLQQIDNSGEFPPRNVDLGGIAATLLAATGGYDSSPAGAGFSTCARLADLSLRCWGDNQYGELGYGHRLTIGDDETPNATGPVPF